ncbi:hypothetical protein C8Q74DRAFT_1189914 [Fomes fomentarius]|nr:hypothetical protein C8Q74DRAFT_1189914 [Fomes fomentarius]
MKRGRTNSTSEADYLKVFQGVMVEKDDEVWLEDGNVILIAERVAFKVYQGLLARRSEVFRDMFTLPGGPAETEKIDGVPVVSVSDSVVNLRHLLLVLCCGKNYFTQRDSDVEFSVVAALVRLGHKYAVQDLLDDALSSLRQLYPSSFLKYTLQQNWGSHASPRDAITAIHLARLTNTPFILPVAFLVCTTLGVELFQPEGGSGTTPLPRRIWFVS